MIYTDRQKEEELYLLKNIDSIVHSTRYARSRINGTWSVTTPTQEIIVRFYPLFFREKFETETGILLKLEHLHEAIPILLKTDEESFESPVLFLSKLPGSPIGDNPLAMNGTALIRALSTMLNKITTISVESIGYLHQPSPYLTIAEYAENEAGKYCASIQNAAILSVDELHLLQRNLLKLPAYLNEIQALLTYPDLSSGNILVHDNHLSGIVDWEFVMGFDPLYGFANLMLEQNSLPGIRWITTAEILGNFAQEDRERLLLLALLRAAELLSYMPTTILFSPSTKKKLLKEYKRSIRDFIELLD